ncbi:sugar nucleotidyltransferase [Halobaculum magnesiiphilum]|uniref:glucose-1-phosphate thymidylyltransferase n=1 Tax=Halobaculum magnesiiphilum TaxID=1017351 RepID=A0A8T8WCH5_9EURY|nr:sugar phosphate nucleotidyltransferase [Halobaculum magnesiiphilum]QZP37521.1 NTP transferase domain-containing protein [Halobaculum magnesiiphilum]
MKGVVLAGGRGTRLRPMTEIMNKHVLPVYDEPMIFYPVRTLLENGISEILVISAPEYIGGYIQLLEERFEDAEFSYKVQDEPAGIAHAIQLAEGFVDDTFAVVLGDNIVMDDISENISAFADSDEDCMIFLKQVSDPSRYGVAEVEDDRVVELKEKPDSPETNTAVIGLYLYTSDVFDRIPELTKSDRGELEVTDLNRTYIEDDSLGYSELTGQWFDVGTPDGLLKASNFVAENRDA